MNTMKQFRGFGTTAAPRRQPSHRRIAGTR